MSCERRGEKDGAWVMGGLHKHTHTKKLRTGVVIGIFWGRNASEVEEENRMKQVG